MESKIDADEVISDHSQWAEGENWENEVESLVKQMNRSLSGRQAQALLRKANDILGGHGVERDKVGQYVNMGDLYNPTFIWDGDQMHYTDLGTMREKMRR